MSRKVRMILGGIGLVVVAVLCWFFLLSPMRGETADLERAIEDEQQKVSIMKTTLAQAQVTREEGRRNQARLLELNKMVPPSEELPSLLLQLQDLADQAGIQFISVTPGAPRVSDANPGYQILELQLQFSGTYFDVSDFAYRAEQMVARPGRLLALKALTLSPGQAAGSGGEVSPELGVSISMYAFILNQGAAAATVPSPTAPAGSQ